MLKLFFLASINHLLTFLRLSLTLSSDVYAVNRNIEDSDQITPLIPPSLDYNSKVSSGMEAEEDQVGPTSTGCFCCRLIIQSFVLHPDRY